MSNEGVRSPQAVENMGKLGLLMGRAKLTTKELSQRTGISINALYGYRRGKRKPTVKCYNALAERLYNELCKRKIHRRLA